MFSVNSSDRARITSPRKEIKEFRIFFFKSQLAFTEQLPPRYFRFYATLHFYLETSSTARGKATFVNGMALEKFDTRIT